ncbi:hypothetical protein V8C35DRAFT_293983 [Trichoderma chlorosporum]
MSEQDVYEATENSDLEIFRNAMSFDFALFEQGDLDSGFHLKNDPEAPYQRENVVQRKGAVYVKCTCIDVIHGKWDSEESGSSATLLVLLFRFNPLKRARRIVTANIELKFFDMEGYHRKNPEVVEISFNDDFSMTATQRTESTTRGVEGTLGSGVLGAELSGTVKYEKRIDEITTDAARLIGSIDRLDATIGPCNAASWTLIENATAKTGIPVSMRVGVLLRRSTDGDFSCSVRLTTKADFKTRMEDLIGGRERDDPILFRTTLPPTNRLMKYNISELGKFDVTSIQDITSATVQHKMVKEFSG